MPGKIISEDRFSGQAHFNANKLLVRMLLLDSIRLVGALFTRNIRAQSNPLMSVQTMQGQSNGFKAVKMMKQSICLGFALLLVTWFR